MMPLQSIPTLINHTLFYCNAVKKNIYIPCAIININYMHDAYSYFSENTMYVNENLQQCHSSLSEENMSSVNISNNFKKTLGQILLWAISVTFYRIRIYCKELCSFLFILYYLVKEVT